MAFGGGDRLTKEELESYRSNLREISYLERKIADMCAREVPVVAGKVMASSKEFPYTQYRVGVLMEEPVENDRIMKRVRLWKDKVKQLTEQTDKVEVFIDSIEDGELRMIFRYRYTDGMKLEEVAKEMHMDRSVIGKKINDHLKVAH